VRPLAALVDTSILIDHLRGRPEARALLEREVMAGQTLFASVLTKVEIRAGMRRGEEDATKSLLGALVWVEVSDPIAERAGELARRYLRSHPGVDLVDFVVAATREELDIPLWTLNIRHFPMVRGLKAPY
jgi:predicted nucleic acid-binding protein